MNSSRKVTVIAAALLLVVFVGSVLSRRQVERLRGNEATLEDVLYLPSGKTVKALSLGYSSLLADIYWTRAVQYFGSRHIQHSRRYELLAPLLDITTDLDPHLMVAYETGSIFLTQKPPDGAGQPDQAVALVEKGIRANPAYWRLYFSLGFIHYVDRKDYKAAHDAFLKGSEIPGALGWMKVMAARMAEKGDDPSTAAYLWKQIYDTTHDNDVRTTALLHLASLRAQVEMDQLEQIAAKYRVQFGKFPGSWTDLSNAGFLRGTPVDPDGNPYKLLADGTVEPEDPSKFPYVERSRPAQSK